MVDNKEKGGSMIKDYKAFVTKRRAKFVTVRLSLENDVILALALMAHEKDITLNELVNEILERQIFLLERKNAKSL